LTVHILSFFGITFGGNALFFGLHIAIFPLWLPIVLLMQKATSGMQTTSGWGFRSNKQLWKMMFAGCPAWMKYMTQGFFYYAIANFVIFVFFLAPTGKSVGAPPPSVVHGFSGHWMLFYSAGLAMATTAYRRGIGNLQAKCMNGHPVSWGDKFCPACGATLSMSIQNGP
jgi:hypothetical protein